MTTSAGELWRPGRTQLVAGAMIVAGFLLAGLSWWFLMLAAAGALGPGMLREFGALGDKDEFQRRTDYRAGYHAFIATGVVGFLLLAFVRSGGEIENPEQLPDLFLTLLWFTWILSSLIAFWGAQKAATRILLGFGAVWLGFTILSNTGSEWTGWAALLLHPLLAAPFFALAWTARRWPRVSGALLIAASLFFYVFFGGPGFGSGGGTGMITSVTTLTLFVGPLLASGIGLVCSSRDVDG